MDLQERFTSFVAQRRTLNERLDATRADLDAWLDAHQDGHVAITEIAWLEGVLTERRELLSKLASLDASFVDALLDMRTSDTAPPD